MKASDNTRAVGEKAADSWLLPADQTRRVILCSGQIYYRLFHARRARQIRDVILVRLEQIAPFPHDLVTQVPAYPLFVHLQPAQYSSQPMAAAESSLEAYSVPLRLMCQTCTAEKHPSCVKHGCQLADLPQLGCSLSP